MVFGKRDQPAVDLARLAGKGYRIDGAVPAGETGASVAGAGDVDGDGRPDQLVAGERTAHIADGAGRRGRLSLAKPGDGATELRLTLRRDFEGPLELVGPGDVNRDGRPDVLVEASEVGSDRSGAAYVLFGSADRRSVRIDRLGPRGIELRAIPGDVFENAVAAAGEILRAMSQENVEVVRSIYEAWARDEFPGPEDSLDPDIEYVNPRGAIEPGTRRGLAAFRQATENVFEGWAAWRMEPEEFRAVGNQVAVVVRYRARGRTSGVDVEGRESALWTLRDGKAVRYEWFHGPEEALEAVGLRE